MSNCGKNISDQWNVPSFFVLAIIFVLKLNAITTLNVRMTVNVINVDTNLFKPEKQLLNDAEYDVRNYAERKLARRPLQTQIAALKKWLLC